MSLRIAAFQYIKELMAEVQENYPEVMKCMIAVNGKCPKPNDPLKNAK